MQELFGASKQTRAWACYDCGKCTATCPISRAGGEYSPRRHVLATNLGHRDEIVNNGSLYQCLTCSLCDSRCPAEVAYTELIMKLREVAHKEGAEPECPHGGAIQSVIRMMAKGTTQQNRLEWLDSELKTREKEGEVFYWTGCTMYYDALFSDLEVSTLNGTRAAIRLMNKFGVEPVVSPEERCCGHDLLWNGDRAGFEGLARHNVDLVAKSGARLLVVSCAECLRTWKIDYKPFFETAPPRILHITEYLEEHLHELKLSSNGKTKITYQDPCRLGRHLGIYESPRKILKAIPGAEMVEMRRSGSSAMCCAGGTWSGCDRVAKTIQVDRLKEARSTGAVVLATACPKCQVHFRCSMKDPIRKGDIEIEMRDVAELLADALA